MRIESLTIAATVASVGIASCTQSTQGGLWRSDVAPLPVAAAGWTGGPLANAETFFAYRHNALLSYSLRDNAWTVRTPDPAVYTNSGSGVADGVLYECGQDSAAKLVCSRYDEASDAWTDLAPNPARLLVSVAVAGLDGVLYLVGPCPGCGANDQIYSFDLATQTWGYGGTFSGFGATFPVMAALDGSVYRIGSADDIPETHRFDPATSTVTVLNAVPPEVTSVRSAVVVGDEIWVLSDSPDSLQASIWSWRPADDRWSRVQTVPVPRVKSSMIGDASHLFVLGGFADLSETTPSDAADLYYVP